MKQTMKRVCCALLILALSAGIVPTFGVVASAADLTERQQAVLAVAMAYYDKGEGMQYDGAAIVGPVNRKDGGKTRSTNCEPPEYATPNETLFSVCSDYCDQVYWEAFRFHIVKTAGAATTYAYQRIVEGSPMFVGVYDKEKTKDVEKTVHEMFTAMQPGDVITTMSTAGHSMIYLGDVLGDGKTYIAHCYGASINATTGADTREVPAEKEKSDLRYRNRVFDDATGGSIRLTPYDEQSLLNSTKSQNVINIIRPLAGMTESEYPITAATRYRMSHPRLAVNRTLNKTRFTSPLKGETLTLTLALSNRSKQSYSVPVTEKIPQGVSLKSASDGANASGDTITWNVELPAGSEKTLTVEYEVTAARGEQIVFTGGSVGDIPSNTIPVTVGGAKLNADDLAKLKAVAAGDYDKALKAAKPTGASLPGYVYKNVLGLDITIPDAKTVLEKLTEPQSPSDKKVVNVFKDKSKIAQDDLFTYQMVVPMFHGGKQVWNEWGHERCNDPKDMHLEPGDIIIRMPNVKQMGSVKPLIYLGSGRYLTYDSAKKAYPVVEEPELVRSLTYDCFYCLRPSLAYDDLHAQAVTPDAVASPYVFPLTDVKESDWFYPYVRDLYMKGVVSGMTPTTFEPNGTLTYGQALKLVAETAFEAEPPKSGKHWASGYLDLAKKNGWLTEDVDLDAKITREAFCIIAHKPRKINTPPEKNPFTDTDNRYVLGMYRIGIINGMTETTFEPNGLLTRAQIAKIIWIMTCSEMK